MPVFRPRDAAFQYGNYNRYYGYRNPDPGQVSDADVTVAVEVGWG